MLSLQEFSAGRLGDAQPMSLFLPGSKTDATTLVVGLKDARLLAVVLEGTYAFKAFDCTENSAWRGMIIHPITIEVDQKGLIDLDRFDVPLGCVIRKGSTLSVAAHDEGGFRTARKLALVEGLSPGGGGLEIGFTRWSVVIGSGQDKRVLFTVDRPMPKDD